MLPALLLAAGLAIFLPAPVDAGARFVQHLLSLSVQVLAAATAAATLFQAARTYGPRDHERRVWRLNAGGAPGWAAGVVIQGLAGTGVLLWVVVIGGFMWPLLSSPLDPLEKGLDLFYASTIALLVPLALGPAMAFRGGASGYVWLGVAVGVAGLTLAGLGFAYLTFYELYTDVHPINLLRVAGLVALSASGAWQRRMIEAV